MGEGGVREKKQIWDPGQFLEKREDPDPTLKESPLIFKETKKSAWISKRMPHNGKENCLHYPQNSPVHPISQWNNGIEEEEKILKVLKVKRKNYEFSFKVWSLYCISLILTIPVFEFEIRFSDARFLSQEISRIYGIFDIRSITTHKEHYL